MATIPVPAVIVSTSDPRLFPSEEERERERAEAREKALPPSRPVLYTTVSDDPPENKGCLGKCDFAACECLYFAGKGGVCGRCSHANLYHRVKIRRVDLEAKMAAGANTGIRKRSAQAVRLRLLQCNGLLRFRVCDGAALQTNALLLCRNGAPCSSPRCVSVSAIAATVSRPCCCPSDALKKMKHRRHIPTQKEIEEQKVQEENKPPEPINTYPCDVMDCECKKSVQDARLRR